MRSRTANSHAACGCDASRRQVHPRQQSRQNARDCLHCGQPVPDSALEAYCCAGCRTAHQLLRAAELTRFYDLRGRNGTPAMEAQNAARYWVETEREKLASGHLALDVQGLHCSACVWLIEQLFDRMEQGQSVTVMPSIGRMELKCEPGFDLEKFVRDVESFGYRIGPAVGGVKRRSDSLLLRLGVCAALALNSMMFSVSVYLGLKDGPLYAIVGRLEYVLAVLAVGIGGTYFFRAAAASLRKRILHLDLPIALGIGLSFLLSSLAFFGGAERAPYLDTVTVFITLMLLGRYLQERVLERNRDRLLDGDHVASLLTNIVQAGHADLQPVTAVKPGDVLRVAPLDLVPVDAELLDASAQCSLEWCSGESDGRLIERGQSVPAGAFNTGRMTVHVRALQSFEDSDLSRLLQRAGQREHAGIFWERLAKVYVWLVLTTASLAFVAWMLLTGSASIAMQVTTAILVVTCPCAFGIATPLAYELVSAELRQRGLFVTSGSFLDRVRAVRRVVFDKTGTLTSGQLSLQHPEALADLAAKDRDILYTLASHSHHPKSRAVARVLRQTAACIGGVAVLEVAGRGVELQLDSSSGPSIYRFGAPSFVGTSRQNETAPQDTEQRGVATFGKDGQAILSVRFEEQLRPDAPAEIKALEQQGYEVHILSGDEEDKVAEMAARLGLDSARCRGRQSPDEKAAQIAAIDQEDTLMIGDGVNDSLALQAAHCSGTPAVDRPFMAARCDFYVTAPGIAPIAQSLRLARQLAQVVRANLIFAVAYNLIAVTIAATGQMQPWLAAVLMPASSLTSLVLTGTMLRRQISWKY
ncbi:MAG: heavy metal translocating P-type ATPase metal-binding domain-containing protein [Myxococcota bacterium]